MRCTFRSRRPRPRYHTRFMRGPSFAIAFFTYRFSSVKLKLFSALAMADRTTRPSGSEVDFGRFSRIAIASSALLPLMRSVTRRAFRGESRRKRADAFTSTSSTRPYVGRALRRAGARCGRPRAGCGRCARRLGRRDRAPVATEVPCRGELAEPVANHVLGDEDRHVTPAVVNRDGVADHDRQDHRRPRPGLHDLLLVPRVQDVDLLFQGLLDEGSLLYGATHLDFLFGGRSVTNRSVRGLLRVLRPMAGLPQGVCAWPPTGDLASPPPWGWSRGDITTPRTAGRQPMWRLWPAPPTFWFSCSTLPI